MRRARIWGWARTRRCDEPLNDLGPSSRHQSYLDCIIATHGYDFREGHALPRPEITGRAMAVGCDFCGSIGNFLGVRLTIFTNFLNVGKGSGAFFVRSATVRLRKRK